MKLSEVKNRLALTQTMTFTLPNGSIVPEHFHVTEVGVITKNFIDCGGTVRSEKIANFQLWNAGDVDHRLRPQKLIDIILLSEKVLNMEDFEVEVEYQSETIGKYGLEFNGESFVLTSKQTNCLASDSCGTSEKKKVSLAALQNENQSCCSPESGCCN